MLIELAARCEKATAPDRELDREIWAAATAVPPANAHALKYVQGPDYTASLDAAMTLVPEGMEWFKERGAYVPNIAVVQGPVCSFVGETDSTFALALCAAALRARAGGGHEGR